MIKIESKQGRIGKEERRKKPQKRRRNLVTDQAPVIVKGSVTEAEKPACLPYPTAGLTGLDALLHTVGVKGLIFEEVGKVFVRVENMDIDLPKIVEGREVVKRPA